MYFCVLLTTQGRLNYLERLFESLLHQTYRNFFVLLGDQSAEGELDALLSRYEKNFRIDRHILPQLSLSAARNALLPFVEGDYIYFSDDDSYLAPSTFAIMAQYARKWPRAGALIGSGQSKPGLEKPCAGSLPSRELSAYSVFRNCPSWCIFVKKDVPQLIGFFDENIGVGASTPWQSGEETDYLLRILAAGMPVVHCSKAHLYHDAEANHPLDLDKTRNYSAGRMYTIKKHSLPAWFAICNVLYPLSQIIAEVPRDGLPALKRRTIMFYSRLRWLIKLALK